MAGEDRSRLHEIVDEIPEADLPVARQLLELLARGLAAPPRPASTRTDGANGLETTSDVANDDGDDDGDDDEDEAEDEDELTTSPETLAKLAQLTDDELVQLDTLLESDREAARAFWRARFGEDLPDDDLVEDGHR